MTTKMVGAIVFLFLIIPANSFSQSLEDPEVIDLFMTARAFFRTIESQDYSGVWASITAKSRKKIIDAIYKEQKKTGEYSTREHIKRDFDICGVVCRSFWRAYSRTFDPESTLKQSRWDLGYMKKKKAEILITHQMADRPAKLKLFREEGMWKVGLMESFWSYWTRR